MRRLLGRIRDGVKFGVAFYVVFPSLVLFTVLGCLWDMSPALIGLARHKLTGWTPPKEVPPQSECDI